MTRRTCAFDSTFISDKPSNTIFVACVFLSADVQSLITIRDLHAILKNVEDIWNKNDQTVTSKSDTHYDPE